jgi:hemolysin activation/secretion protein
VRQIRAGFSHWIEVERAGNGLGGDFNYTRYFGDVRGVLRLSPATTLILRAVAGHGAAGTLPLQKQFPIGGPDALRAHVFASIQGDQLALAQAEYMIALWRLRTRGLEGGLHALAFLDAGNAWSDPHHRWNVADQRFNVDGGFGIATGEDNLRLYVAKNLHDTDSDLVVSLRLRRPF